MIINKKDLEEVRLYLSCINEVMKKNVELIELLDRCELMIIGIIENITSQADFGFIIRRIQYLQNTLAAFSN